MTKQFIVASSPHIRAPETTADIMRAVCLALAPAFAVAVYNFGLRAWFIAALTVGACMLTEWVCCKMCGKKSTLADFSAVVSGLLLAATLPPNIAWWLPVIGGIFAMGIVKHAFGGLGSNIWNPALAARAFLQISFPTAINSPQWIHLNDNLSLAARLKVWLNGDFAFYQNQAAVELTTVQNFIAEHGGVAMLSPSQFSYDVVSSATVLTSLKNLVNETANSAPTVARLLAGKIGDIERMSFFGWEGGCIAETSALALLIGGLFLVAKKIIDWETPLIYLATLALLTWVLPVSFANVDGGRGWTSWFGGAPLLQISAGGAFLTAFFMDTDYATTPLTKLGRMVFAAGGGIITALIRLYSPSYPEGCCYSILIMNTCVPLIDLWTRPRPFGK